MSVVVIAVIGLVYLDHGMTEKRLQVLPPPSPVPTATSVPTATPTPIPSVRVIYAIPADTSYEFRYEQAIRKAVLGAQHWYGEQLGGATFAVSGPLPHICLVKEQASYFHGADGWHRAIASVQHCDQVEYYSEWYTWVIYIDVNVPCEAEDKFILGRGGGGVAVLHGGDIRGLIEPDGFQPCDNGRWHSWPRGRWVGGLAHELAHAFGVGHPSACEADPECGDQSLMWHGFVHYPDTFVHDDDAATLMQQFSRH